VVLAIPKGEAAMSPVLAERPRVDAPSSSTATAEAVRLTPSRSTIPAHVARFDAKTRAMHLVVMTTFLGLSATGMPLLFSDAAWARALASVFGGFRGAGIAHRAFGAALLAVVVFHLADVAWRAFVRGERGLLWGPTSMMPQPRDAVDFYRQLKWFAGLGPRPSFEHFAYWEKFDYWAVLWGTAIMGAAGLILWFPVAASRVLPGWMFNVALFVHGAEATLAIGFIFAVHFFNGHLRPGKFPMDLVIFTGSIPATELQHERADEYRRLIAADAGAAIEAPGPTPQEIRRGRIAGTIGLSLGLALFALIMYAVIG
jgi:cytochrome b subunit of formate dehydrogenase